MKAQNHAKAQYFVMIVLLCGLLLFVQNARAQATGSVEASWDAVTTYVTGETITNPDTLAALRYAIYYGLTSRGAITTPPAGYPNKIEDIGVTTIQINNLSQGNQYFFSVTAYYINIDDVRFEGAFSVEASVVIPVEIDTNILTSPAVLTITIRPATP